MNLGRRLAAAFTLLFATAACSGIGAPAPSPTHSIGDVQRVWCGAHPEAVVTAGQSLRIQPSRFVVHKAEVEQATLDGDSARAESLILQWVGQEITATDSDPHPDLTSMQSWEADSVGDWQRACVSAWGAK